MSLAISEGLLREALAHLYACGRRSRECVCWLTGPLARPGALEQVLHPAHSASASSYEIEQAWLNDTFIALARAGHELRAQIHSHPGTAYHSSIDDAYPAVRSPGFVSIVVPNFATARNLSGAHASLLDEHGAWGKSPLAEALRVTA
jgi:hypothetical protein